MRNYLRLSQVLNKALIQLSMCNAMTLLRFCHSATCHVIGLLTQAFLSLALELVYTLSQVKSLVNTFL